MTRNDLIRLSIAQAVAVAARCQAAAVLSSGVVPSEACALCNAPRVLLLVPLHRSPSSPAGGRFPCHILERSPVDNLDIIAWAKFSFR